MARNESDQEKNLKKHTHAFMKKLGVTTGGGPGTGIKILFRNNSTGIANVTELNDITYFESNPDNDNSAVDIIAIRSDGAKFGISCKQHNPGSFCGAGLKSFAGTGPDGDIVMRKWMTKVLGEAGAYYLNIVQKRMDTLGNKVLNLVKNGKPLTATQKTELKREWERAKGTLPQLYIPIPRGMRFQLLRGDGHSGREKATHFITGGKAMSPDTDISNRTITFNDCDFYTLNEIAQKEGNNLYIVIRKRRADQLLDILDTKGLPITDSNKFLKLFTGSSGRRIQVRQKDQLPKTLRQYILSDNSQESPTIQLTPSVLTPRVKGVSADILEVPLPLNPTAASAYNK